MKKTNNIFARVGFSDLVLPVEQFNDPSFSFTPSGHYLVGYEDEAGNECEEDGTYLDQTIEIE